MVVYIQKQKGLSWKPVKHTSSLKQGLIPPNLVHKLKHRMRALKVELLKVLTIMKSSLRLGLAADTLLGGFFLVEQDLWNTKSLSLLFNSEWFWGVLGFIKAFFSKTSSLVLPCVIIFDLVLLTSLGTRLEALDLDFPSKVCSPLRLRLGS